MCLAIYLCIPLFVVSLYPCLHPEKNTELWDTRMKRADIKRRPLADTTLAGLEPESKEYRELDGNGLYLGSNLMVVNPGSYATNVRQAIGLGWGSGVTQRSVVRWQETKLPIYAK